VSAITLERAGFRYAGGHAPALDGISFSAGPGEIILVAGRPGSGTSTLLLVAGGYAPRVVGGELTGTRTIGAKKPAIVFATPWTQLTGLCHTVFAEVAFGPASHGETVERILEIVPKQLDRLGILHLAERDPSTLSGGELQRTIVAAALALEPDLLLLDDPTAELDPAGADGVYELLREIAAGGAAVLVATPDVERATRVASRAIVLEAGRVIHDGSPAGVEA